MPNVRKQIFDQIAERLRTEARQADHELWKNKFEFKKLVARQKELKARAAELHRLAEEFAGNTNRPGGRRGE